MKLKALIIPAAVMVLGLTACGGNGGSKEVDVQATADALKDTITVYEMTPTAETMIGPSFTLDFDALGVAKAAAYTQSASHYTKVCVVECGDAKQASAVEEKFKELVENDLAAAQSYYMEDVPYLENAVVESSGKYAAICVTDDADAAKKVLKEAGF